MGKKFKVMTKQNRHLFLMFAGCVFSGTIGAQTTIKGVVTDQHGEPLIGANVRIKNTNLGTVTDFDGRYTLTSKKTLTRKDRIVFSYIGFQEQETVFSGEVMNAKLKDDYEEMNEVVVTALGIKREEKSLGYATETVTGGQITDAVSSNWSMALNGKVAGLTVTSSGGPLSSSKISY